MIEPLYREHASTVRALAYRMTGSMADAEEISQETFTRALASPPGSVLGRNWLLSVAANLARDRLRRRKRAAYIGPWLPEAMEAEAEPGSVDPERGYGLRESASFAFLLALEPLTSRQRAVLLLRDVFDLSVEETAAILRMGEGAVRVMHHRAERRSRATTSSEALPRANDSGWSGARSSSWPLPSPPAIPPGSRPCSQSRPRSMPTVQAASERRARL